MKNVQLLTQLWIIDETSCNSSLIIFKWLLLGYINLPQS